MQNSLGDKRQVILIVRLTLGGQGQFVHGEVIELEGRRIGRFLEWPKMTNLVEVWLASQQKGDELGSPGE